MDATRLLQVGERDREEPARALAAHRGDDEVVHTRSPTHTLSLSFSLSMALRIAYRRAPHSGRLIAVPVPISTATRRVAPALAPVIATPDVGIWVS